MKFKRAIKHLVTIEASGNGGFLVTVGCGKFVFENGPSLVEGLKYYLEDPDGAEKKYNEISATRTPLTDCQPEENRDVRVSGHRVRQCAGQNKQPEG